MMNLYKLLEKEKATCVILENNNIIFVSSKSGVAPMIEFYKLFSDKHKNLTVIDKIMGRGAVLLAKLIGATKIVTPMISETALELAKEYSMDIEYLNLVPYIINRAKDGQCPIEKSVLNVSDTKLGYQIITKTLALLAKAN